MFQTSYLAGFATRQASIHVVMTQFVSALRVSYQLFNLLFFANGPRIASLSSFPIALIIIA